MSKEKSNLNIRISYKVLLALEKKFNTSKEELSKHIEEILKLYIKNELLYDKEITSRLKK